MENELNGMIENAMKDPRFAEILSSLKQKADSGELDVSSLTSKITSDTESAKAEGVMKDAPKHLSAQDIERHSRLLSALKPYLAEEKRGAVENILKISRFSGVLETLMKNGKED